MTERMASGWDDRLEAGYREPKRFERRSQDGGSNRYNFGGDITKESEEMQIEALFTKKCMAKNIISAVIHVDDNAPSGIAILCR